MFNIGEKLTNENYTDGAIWCNENNAQINSETLVIEAIPEPSETEVAQIEIKKLKKELGESDYIDNKFLEAIVTNDTALLEELKVKYKEKLEQRQSIRIRIRELKEIVNE